MIPNNINEEENIDKDLLKYKEKYLALQECFLHIDQNNIDGSVIQGNELGFFI